MLLCARERNTVHTQYTLEVQIPQAISLSTYTESYLSPSCAGRTQKGGAAVFVNHVDVQIALERHKDFVREAQEQNRSVGLYQGRSGRIARRVDGVVSRFRMWVGRRVVTTGRVMQGPVLHQ